MCMCVYMCDVCVCVCVVVCVCVYGCVRVCVHVCVCVCVFGAAPGPLSFCDLLEIVWLSKYIQQKLNSASK